jgi:hypothetical protein
MFFFDAGVQKADVRNAIDHRLAIQFEQETQHAMRGRVLRPHVQEHRLALEGFFGDEVLQIFYGNFK